MVRAGRFFSYLARRMYVPFVSPFLFPTNSRYLPFDTVLKKREGNNHGNIKKGVSFLRSMKPCPEDQKVHVQRPERENRPCGGGERIVVLHVSNS